MVWKILQLTMHLQFFLIHCFTIIFNHEIHCPLNTGTEISYFHKAIIPVKWQIVLQKMVLPDRLVALLLAMFSSMLWPHFEWVRGRGGYNRNRNWRDLRIGKMMLISWVGHTQFACVFNFLIINSSYSGESFDWGM